MKTKKETDEIFEIKDPVFGAAMRQCHGILQNHRRNAFYFLGLIYLVLVLFVCFIILIVRDPDTLSSKLPSLVFYSIFVFGIILVTTFSLIYRQHLSEASKAEKNITGFMRIYVAGNYHQGGFSDGNVRKALSKDAFAGPDAREGKSKEVKLKNVAEVHPAFDLLHKSVKKLSSQVKYLSEKVSDKEESQDEDEDA